MKHLAVLGGGSWGTALAIALAPRFEWVRLWVHDRERAAHIAQHCENTRYLPGFRLPATTAVTSDLSEALSGSDVILAVVPSAHFRSVLALAKPHIRPGTPIVSATKGLEDETFFRMSEIAADITAPPLDCPIAVLSGPTFAREIAAGEPAAVVIASNDPHLAAALQHAFATQTLRFYASDDVIGVEIGAALKNVIAIGAGICSGLGLGTNSVAALITRGLAEITRIAVNMGANPRTLSGLAGLGDLVLTATGGLSRNRHVGVQLGQGHKLGAILSGMTMVAEGVATCRAAHHLSLARSVDLPIINKMHEVLYEDKDPRRALRELLERPLTSE